MKVVLELKLIEDLDLKSIDVFKKYDSKIIYKNPNLIIKVNLDISKLSTLEDDISNFKNKIKYKTLDFHKDLTKIG